MSDKPSETPMSSKFIVNTPYMGHWQIGGPTGLGLAQISRPRWFTRLMAKWLLEWEWRDKDGL